MNIKSYFIGVLSGILMAFIACFFFNKRDIPVIKESFIAEKNAEEISPPVHKVETQGQKAVFTYTIPTEYYGNLQGEVIAPRRLLQYNHRVGVGAVFLNSGALARVSYSYKSWDFALYGGYDMKNREALFGAGIGYSWGW